MGFLDSMGVCAREMRSIERLFNNLKIQSAGFTHSSHRIIIVMCFNKLEIAYQMKLIAYGEVILEGVAELG